MGFCVSARNIKSENYRYDTLVCLGILEDTGNMDAFITRGEFAKIVIRASEFNDKVSDFISENVCSDVKYDTGYASYIKKALDNKYMYTYLGGLFKPNEFASYSDLTRACLALLGYEDSDFSGNKVYSRNQKFEKIKLNEHIDKSFGDTVTKKDIANAIYNTLKEKRKNSSSVYGTTIFDKLIIDSDGELNASEYKKNKVIGPLIIKNINDIDFDFETNKRNIYINGVQLNYNSLKDDIINYGFAICYIDVDDGILYSYTEREDVSSQIVLRKGYIYKIYYSAANMSIPYRVDIDNYKYMLESEEVKFAFSANGSFKEQDEIVYICNKMNDVTTAYLDESGKVVHKNDDAELYNGSIVFAFDKNEIM